MNTLNCYKLRGIMPSASCKRTRSSGQCPSAHLVSGSPLSEASAEAVMPYVMAPACIGAVRRARLKLGMLSYSSLSFEKMRCHTQHLTMTRPPKCARLRQDSRKSLPDNFTKAKQSTRSLVTEKTALVFASTAMPVRAPRFSLNPIWQLVFCRLRALRLEKYFSSQ